MEKKEMLLIKMNSYFDKLKKKEPSTIVSEIDARDRTIKEKVQQYKLKNPDANADNIDKHINEVQMNDLINLKANIKKKLADAKLYDDKFDALKSKFKSSLYSNDDCYNILDQCFKNL